MAPDRILWISTALEVRPLNLTAPVTSSPHVSTTWESAADKTYKEVMRVCEIGSGRIA